MPLPFQCLLYCPRINQRSLIIAASGPYLHTFDIGNGKCLCTWSPSNGNETIGVGRDDLIFEGNESPSPPAKRPKVASERSESSSAEIVVEKQQASSAPSPPIVTLAATQDGSYVVTVTGEDKCIRVLEMCADGKLKTYSERIMPKRPCAVAMSPDGSRLLCADKFGDVYALPLLGQSYEVSEPNGSRPHDTGNGKGVAAPERFVPSASSLTVHTKRNREALRQQQTMMKKKPQKRSTAFDHELILGHISLLTGILYASVLSASGVTREYILTADRDEHIRISRGLPQAHVIEGYCLGHTQFINKLSLLLSDPQFLVSGGGDDFLLLWHWPTSSIKQRVDLRLHVENIRKHKYDQQERSDGIENLENRLNASDLSGEPFAVSNILFCDNVGTAAGSTLTRFVVTIEGLPALFVFGLTKDARLEYLETYSVLGNVIDIAFLDDCKLLLYSMDCLHQSFTTDTIVDEAQQNARPSVGAAQFDPTTFMLTQPKKVSDALLLNMEKCAKSQKLIEQANAAKGKSLRDVLYGLESLRKRGTNDANEEG